jgi:XTP/dITP diphosphohydrolase
VTNPFMTLVMATTNAGKLREFQSLLAGFPVKLVSVAEVLGAAPQIVENGATFDDNATLKARSVAQLTGMAVIADDSGLEVDALGGRPGVRSARFAHERATDAENNAMLLRELEEVDEGQRTARFRCVLVVAAPWESERLLRGEGRCEGIIARYPRGSGGFGYDPLFMLPDYEQRTMAELTDAEKNATSHRGRAVQALLPSFSDFLSRQLAFADSILG